MLLTRSRLCPRASPGSSLHLHVLGTPPAFVLSQDQTLRERLACQSITGTSPGSGVTVLFGKLSFPHELVGPVHRGPAPDMTGFTTQLSPHPKMEVEPGRNWRSKSPVAHAVEFSKTAAPAEWGLHPSDTSPRLATKKASPGEAQTIVSSDRDRAQVVRHSQQVLAKSIGDREI